jgi:NodT family efflux transporter outer membrane factor (OMF) lipoprotein
MQSVARPASIDFRFLHAVVWVLALGLTSCASMHGLHTHATRIDAAHLEVTRSVADEALSAAAWPTNAWWEAFGDDQLDRLMTRALGNQPNLRIAEARVRRAQALASAIGASLYPQVNARLSSTRERFSEDGTVPPPIAGTWQNINEASLGVSWQLDFWGENRAAVDAAIDRAHAAEVDLQAAKLMLTVSLARAYLRLDLAYAQRDVAQATLEEREQTLDVTRKRVAARIDSDLELTQAESALPATRSRIAALNGTIDLIDNQIAALEGDSPDAGLKIDRPRLASAGSVAIPTSLPAELVGRRPDVVAERWLVEAASQDVSVAKAKFYPNINLTSLIGLQSLGFDDFLDAGSRVIVVGPAISLPIFDGGRLRGNLGAQQAAYDATVEHYNATLIAAVHDVVDQLVSLRWLQQQMQQQDAALRLSGRALALAQSRYRAGLVNYLQVLSAQDQVFAQREARVILQSRHRELQLNLVRALGGGYEPSSGGGVLALGHHKGDRR